MEQETQAIKEVVVEKNTQPTVLLNSEGICVGVNEKKLAEIGYDRDEMISESCCKFLSSCEFKAGTFLQKIIDGKEIKTELHHKRKDGSTYYSEKVGKSIEVDGETYAKVVGVEKREAEAKSGSKKPDASTFEDINQDQLERIVQNVRIDAPSGKMPLNAVLLDLAVGHNELEQYKQGALSLHQALDERLEEEKKNNPDSLEADVLRETKATAFGLYLRVQRGDLELHGSREGKYSGYFN